MSAGWITNATIPYKVQLGTWTNWSQGPIFGATLTLSRRDGNLLIAFTAFFVSLVSTRVWRILCLTFHRWCSTPEPQDALHHQRQAIFRNSANAESSLWTIGQLMWAWRRSARRPIWRTLPMLAAAVLCIVAFTAASGLSSRISTGISNEVLIDGSNCGLIQGIPEAAPAHPDAAAVVQAHTASLVESAANYAQQCYATSPSGVFDCKTFAVNKLPAVIDTNAACPFPGDVCRSNSGNLLLDTGYIDSNDHLGINSPDSERILFRQVYQCAPLQTQGHKRTFDGLNETYTRYDYGPALVGSQDNRTTLDYTYEVESLESQYFKQLDNRQRAFGRSFRLSVMTSLLYNGNISSADSDFITSPELRRQDGDINLIFLIGNGVSFLAPNNDSWYRGNVSIDSYQAVSSVLVGKTQAYLPEEAASPMGCVEQYQYCNKALPEGERCGPLAGYLDAMAGAASKFGLTPKEVFLNQTADDGAGSRFLWFVNTLIRAAIMPKDVITTLQVQGLMSKQTQYSGFQSALPSNQWQLDTLYRWATWLSALQGSPVQAATGLTQDLQSFNYPPGDSIQRSMCNSQKIQTTDYTSFSLFGLYFVFVTGGLIITTSFALEPIFDCLQRRKHRKAYQCLEWKVQGFLHLQRYGYQGLGDKGGTWSRVTDDIPITESGQILESLAISTVASKDDKAPRDAKALARTNISPLASIETIPSHVSGGEVTVVESHSQSLPEISMMTGSLSNESPSVGSRESTPVEPHPEIPEQGLQHNSDSSIQVETSQSSKPRGHDS